MEATGRDGIRTGSSSSGVSTVSSSRSGTIVSTAYISSACGSCLSSLSLSLSLDLATHFVDLEIHEDTEIVQHINKFHRETEEGRSRMDDNDIRSLVQEFFAAAPSDMGVLERWFTELGVAWVLHLAGGDGASAGKLEHASAAASWMCGLSGILETVRSTVLFLSTSGSLAMPQGDKHANTLLDETRFARFIKEAMLKILPFVDIAIRQVVVYNVLPQASYKKLHTLLPMYKALSEAPDRILSLFGTHSAETESILHEMVSLFSAKQGEVAKAIWSTMEHTRTLILESMEDDDDSFTSLAPQASSDIHEATQSVMWFTSFLCNNYLLIIHIVSHAARVAKYVPQFQCLTSLDRMIIDVTSCLQKKLVKVSGSFTDHGLKFLFLLNNSHIIRESLQRNLFYSYLDQEVERYKGSYLEVSWAPVLLCLFRKDGKTKSTSSLALLRKSESEFEKRYTTQKLWKVPDPNLRKTLRTAITQEIIPKYTKYIEDNKVNSPKFSAQELEEMTQELFEG